MSELSRRESGTRIVLHAGLPRTATTALQKNVFPMLTRLHYVGKHADNELLREKFQPLALTRLSCRKYLAGDPAGMHVLRALLGAIMSQLTNANRSKRADAPAICRLWVNCMDIVSEELAGKPVLYSDETMVESMSGLDADLGLGDSVPLEQLHEAGLLERSSLSVVLREPAEFLKASYYKTMEFAYRDGKAPFTFDTYLSRQLAIHERHSPASRIFLCMHRTAIHHFRRLCARTVVTHYRDLVASDNPIDTLLGMQTGDVPARLQTLPRENSSWRRPQVNQFILAAGGLPRENSIDDYARTFPEALHRHSLDRLFAAEAVTAAADTSP